MQALNPFGRAGISIVSLIMCGAAATSAQIAAGATKFLGNITTANSLGQDEVRPDFNQYWNQITSENACKWGTIEVNQGRKLFARCDSAYRYSRRNGFPFKFHALVWGSQYPAWMDNLSVDKQKAAITNFMDTIAARYPDAEMIDVVNEAYHAFPRKWAGALGDTAVANPQWVIEAFRMARARWPKATLILNDFNNFRWDVDNFIAIAKAVRSADPSIIDGIGCQAHDLSRSSWNGNTIPEMTATDLAAVLKKLYDETGLPIYVTELDLSYEDDQEQLNAYQSLFPVMWESEYVADVTLWGYIYGKTWDQAKFSGLIKNGLDRPAFTWLKQYVKDHLNPKSPVGVLHRDGSKAKSLRSGLVVRNHQGRLEIGIERDGKFLTRDAVGRD